MNIKNNKLKYNLVVDKNNENNNDLNKLLRL